MDTDVTVGVDGDTRPAVKKIGGPVGDPTLGHAVEVESELGATAHDGRPTRLSNVPRAPASSGQDVRARLCGETLVEHRRVHDSV
jgi:hypothetical protein